MLKNAKWIKSPENTDEVCYEFYAGFEPKKEVENRLCP